jgi:hypothetical protein
VKFVVLLFLVLTSCAKPLDSFQLCDNYCNSSGEGYVDVKQMSYGVCICNNEEGNKVSLGYHLLLNNKCNVPKDPRRYQ